MSVVVFLMIRLPPRSTRTDTLFPYTTRFRSLAVALDLGAGGYRQQFMPDVATHPGRLVELDRLGADAADHLAADQHLVGHHLADHAGILAAGKPHRSDVAVDDAVDLHFAFADQIAIDRQPCAEDRRRVLLSGGR